MGLLSKLISPHKMLKSGKKKKNKGKRKAREAQTIGGNAGRAINRNKKYRK